MEERPRILIVDDSEVNIDVLIEVLQDEYEILVATDGQTAVGVALQEQPDLILLDVMMPKMNGYEVCRRIKSDKWAADTPIIFVTAMGSTEDEEKGLQSGAVDYLVKPINPAITRARVRTHLELKTARDALKNQNRQLEKKVIQRTKELQLTQDVTIHGLAGLAETRDNETGQHIRRTQHYVLHLAKALRSQGKHTELLTDSYVNLLFKSAPLHDIGKVGVPDSVLLKPGKLTDEEWVEMKKHTTYGYEALLNAESSLGTSSFLGMAKDIARYHHESWDGKGYPEGLSGTDIPLSARIMKVADIYDAIISKRVYKPAMSHIEAADIITRASGTIIDPEVAEAFGSVKKSFRKTALELADGDEQRATIGNE